MTHRRSAVDLDVYRQYIGRSRGEFTVAKDQNVRLRSGWFSDRSASYLACGRPVITQETGFSNILPTGEGLFASRRSTTSARRRAHQQRLPAAFAGGSCHRPRVVRLPRGAGCDARVHRRRPGARRRTIARSFRRTWCSRPVSRWPTTLPRRHSGSHGAPLLRASASRRQRDRVASIVVVTYDGLVFTRLCLETLLAAADVDRVRSHRRRQRVHGRHAGVPARPRAPGWTSANRSVSGQRRLCRRDQSWRRAVPRRFHRLPQQRHHPAGWMAGAARRAPRG